MQKMKSLRQALTDAVPQLKTNPEMMRIFADEGNIDARLAASLSHEKNYTLNVIVCDFVGDPDLIFVPVAAWLRENQPDNLGGDFKEFQSAYEAVGTDLFDQQEGSLRKLTQTATQYVLRLDGWIQKNKGLATTLGVVVGGALALIGVMGGIGLVAWPVVMGINAIIAAAGVLGVVFSTVGGAIVTAIGAISLPVLAVTSAWRS